MSTSDVRLATAAEISIRSEQIADHRLVRLEGELDSSSTSTLVAAIRRDLADAGCVRLDASALGFVDSSGLQALVSLRDEARRNGGDLWIEAASRPLERLLQLTALTDLMAPLS